MAGKAFRNITILLATIGLMGGVQLSPADALSDEVLQQRIEAQTHIDKRLEGTQVKVAVLDGEVVLYGTVQLYRQKMLYEQISWHTNGVIEVDNEIRVVPRRSISDQVIEGEIRRIIRQYQRFQGTEISVTITKGHAHLHGTFHSPGDVLFLKHQVAEVEGVTQIEIDVKFVV